MSSFPPIIARMQTRIRNWEQARDDRALFLNCYMRMTSNMLVAVRRQEFEDCAWVDRLLHHFADYYFVALDAYEHDPVSAPLVWQGAHEVTRDPEISAVQKLVLGVNAHINYDLVLTLVDMLGPEWRGLTARERATRYEDHCRVNDVIGRSIDAVQDEVIEPAMPVMEFLDMLMGPVDEFLISRLITHWRENVWHYAMHLLDAGSEKEQADIIRQVETEALHTARAICRS